MPYRADFEPADVGKRVFFAFCWIGKNNHPGPWSPVVSHVIPGGERWRQGGGQGLTPYSAARAAISSSA